MIKKIIAKATQFSYIGVLLIYLLSLCVSIVHPKLLSFLTSNSVFFQINKNKDNVILVLLPLITVIIVYYTTEYKSLTDSFGSQIIKKIIPNNQLNINMNFLVYSIVSIIISIFEMPLLLSIYLFHSVNIFMHQSN